MITLVDLSVFPFQRHVQICANDPHIPQKTVLALGNFDGVHLGHRELLKETVRVAASLSNDKETVLPGAWLFEAPPSDYLCAAPTKQICTTDEKLMLMRESGIRFAFLGDFPTLMSASPEAFVTEHLQKECNAVYAVCGFNYSFGYRGTGTPALLSKLFGGAVSQIPPVTHGGEAISSTRIRGLVEKGAVEEASDLLGRPFSLTLPVLHGKALGRTLHFPTANQSPRENQLIPRSGIYAVRVFLPWESENTVHYGITNIGSRPTVESEGALNLETYILDYSGDLYDKSIRIEFIKRLRAERKMKDLDELKETIQRDEEATRALFGLS